MIPGPTKPERSQLNSENKSLLIDFSGIEAKKLAGEEWKFRGAAVVAGALAGFFSRALTHPLDLIKIRFQIQSQSLKTTRKPKYSSYLEAFSKIYCDEGAKGFYKGHLSAQLLSITSAASYFFFYDLSRKQILKINEKSLLSTQLSEVQVSSCAGFASGLFTLLISYPMDTLRTRFSAQAKTYYHNIPDAVRKISQKEGPKGFYKGIGPAIINNAPTSCLFFTIYSSLNTLPLFKIEDNSNDFEFICKKFVTSATAGIVSKTFSYPLEVVQKRIQVQWLSSKRVNCRKLNAYSGFFDCIKKMAKFEGLSAFFKGYNIAVVRQASMLAISMTVYELCKLRWTVKDEVNSK